MHVVFVAVLLFYPVALSFKNIRGTHESLRIRKSITYEEWLGRDPSYFPAHAYASIPITKRTIHALTSAGTNERVRSRVEWTEVSSRVLLLFSRARSVEQYPPGYQLHPMAFDGAFAFPRWIRSPLRLATLRSLAPSRPGNAPEYCPIFFHHFSFVPLSSGNRRTLALS